MTYPLTTDTKAEGQLVILHVRAVMDEHNIEWAGPPRLHFLGPQGETSDA